MTALVMAIVDCVTCQTAAAPKESSLAMCALRKFDRNPSGGELPLHTRDELYAARAD